MEGWDNLVFLGIVSMFLILVGWVREELMSEEVVDIVRNKILNIL